MSVNIELRGNNDTAEYKAGQDLKDIFDKSLLNATGHIVILTGVTLFGQPTKDIDLIAYGDLKNTVLNYGMVREEI